MSELDESEKREMLQRTRAEIRARIDAELPTLLRSPFQRILADYLECQPSKEDIATFASKYPDRYATALAQLAPLAGFSKEINISGTLQVNVQAMPDSTLNERLQQAEQRLRLIRSSTAIDAKPVEVPQGEFAHYHTRKALQAIEPISPLEASQELQGRSHSIDDALDAMNDSQPEEASNAQELSRNDRATHSQLGESTVHLAPSIDSDDQIIDIIAREIDDVPRETMADVTDSHHE